MTTVDSEGKLARHRNNSIINKDRVGTANGESLEISKAPKNSTTKICSFGDSSFPVHSENPTVCKVLSRQIIATGAAARRLKRKQLFEAVQDISANINLLRHFAITSNGLLAKSVRRRVWPELVKVEDRLTGNEISSAEIYSHKDYQQVNIDVQRSHRRFPPDIDSGERTKLQDKLTNLIIRILLRHPELYYYQGYHDICVTFLIEVGEELAFAIMDKLSITILKEFMEETMEATVRRLNCLYPIIRKYNPNLVSHLEASGVNTVFCLSWVITWFGHVLKNFNDIVRLYDFFLVSHRLMPIYLSAAIVLHREQEILAIETDMATVHHFLCGLTKSMPLEILVKRAFQISCEYPPETVLADAN